MNPAWITLVAMGLMQAAGLAFAVREGWFGSRRGGAFEWSAAALIWALSMIPWLWSTWSEL